MYHFSAELFSPDQKMHQSFRLDYSTAELFDALVHGVDYDLHYKRTYDADVSTICKNMVLSFDALDPSAPMNRFIAATFVHLLRQIDLLHFAKHSLDANESLISMIQAGRMQERYQKQEEVYINPLDLRLILPLLADEHGPLAEMSGHLRPDRIVMKDLAIFGFAPSSLVPIFQVFNALVQLIPKGYPLIAGFAD
jgi:hypothetical protein